MTDWVVIPREPTQEMLDAGDSAFEGGYVREMWSAMIEAAPQPPRPVKGDPMLDAVLDTPNPQFDAWVKSLPPAYWARYDLSACRIGFEAGAAPQQQPNIGNGHDDWARKHYDEAQQQAEPVRSA